MTNLIHHEPYPRKFSLLFLTRDSRTVFQEETMLENSFVHLPGVGPQTEERLWSLGCHNWDHLTERLPEFFGRQKALKLLSAIEESRAAHESGELEYFRERFKGADQWRLVPSILKNGQAENIAYLDIETTGLGFPPASESTSIAVMLKGELNVEYKSDMKRRLLERIEEEAALIVTFNGITFDLPFLRREFDLELRQPHLDLRYWFARLGHKGGLKKIQKSFPEVPQRDSMDIDGFDAVRLWRMHDWGIENALETLLTYNAEDTVVLEQLVFTGLNLEAEKKPHLRLETYELPLPPRIHTRVCPNVYKMLRT
jgi:uncharacterized protein YprB with RNaseH-like and TPR domain